jgi:hypothetical protein
MNRWAALFFVVVGLWLLRMYLGHIHTLGRWDERARLLEVLDRDGPAEVLQDLRLGYEGPDVGGHQFGSWRETDRAGSY